MSGKTASRTQMPGQKRAAVDGAEEPHKRARPTPPFHPGSTVQKPSGAASSATNEVTREALPNGRSTADLEPTRIPESPPSTEQRQERAAWSGFQRRRALVEDEEEEADRRLHAESRTEAQDQVGEGLGRDRGPSENERIGSTPDEMVVDDDELSEEVSADEVELGESARVSTHHDQAESTRVPLHHDQAGSTRMPVHLDEDMCTAVANGPLKRTWAYLNRCPMIAYTGATFAGQAPGWFWLGCRACGMNTARDSRTWYAGPNVLRSHLMTHREGAEKQADMTFEDLIKRYGFAQLIDEDTVRTVHKQPFLAPRIRNHTFFSESEKGQKKGVDVSKWTDLIAIIHDTQRALNQTAGRPASPIGDSAGRDAHSPGHPPRSQRQDMPSQLGSARA